MKRFLRLIAVIVGVYLAAAYVLIPFIWAEHEAGLPDVGREMLTRTTAGIPGDPVNIGFVGSKEEVLRAFAEAAWNPADPVTLASGIEIGLSVILDRPYADAPISTLLYDGRKQDLAFEKQDGASADRRHHLRLWLMPEKTTQGRDLWLGSASYDRGVGISRLTGQVTHHISPDIDAERGYVTANLAKAGAVLTVVEIDGCGPTWEGRNGEGDLYFTDGMAHVVVLKPGL